MTRHKANVLVQQQMTTSVLGECRPYQAMAFWSSRRGRTMDWAKADLGFEVCRISESPLIVPCLFISNLSICLFYTYRNYNERPVYLYKPLILYFNHGKYQSRLIGKQHIYRY